jgi:hypothetical protein
VAIVFKDLQKLVSAPQQDSTHKELFERLQDKPFWIWDKQLHKLEDIRTVLELYSSLFFILCTQ